MRLLYALKCVLFPVLTNSQDYWSQHAVNKLTTLLACGLTLVIVESVNLNHRRRNAIKMLVCFISSLCQGEEFQEGEDLLNWIFEWELSIKSPLLFLRVYKADTAMINWRMLQFFGFP